MRRFLYTSIILAVIQASSAWATTYWVSPTGSDGNSCASVSGEKDPGRYRTVNGGLSCMSGGDTLKLKTGTYNYSFPTNAIPSGLSTSQKTCIVGESRDNTILRPDSTKSGTVLMFTSGRSNLCFRNFTINGDRQGTTGTKTGIRQGGVDGIHHNWEFTDLKIINIGQNLTAPDASNAGNGIVLLTRGTGHYLARLHLENNGTWGHEHGNAIYWRANNSVIEHSYIKRSAHDGLHLSSAASDAAIDNNIIRSNHIVDSDGSGINVYTGNNNLVQNNVVWNARSGINIRRNGNQIYNNSVYAASSNCLRLQQGAHVARNNIFLNCGKTPILNQSSGSTLSNNLTSGKASDIFANSEAGDFTLKSDIGAGATITNVNTVVLTPPPTPTSLNAVAQ